MKEKSLIDEYFEYQLEYEKRYGSESVVLMEVGSFFEVYSVNNEFEKIGKAEEIASVLNIQLTRKDKSVLENSRKNPLLCGVPTVSFGRYLDILLKLNRYTIVILEQTSPPPKVKRKVTKILSPGTQIETYSEENSYLMSLVICQERNRVFSVGCSYIDLSTGENSTFEIYGTLDDKHFSLDAVLKLIRTVQPKEILINTLDVKDLNNEDIINYFEINSLAYHIFNDNIDSIYMSIDYQNELLKSLFKFDSLLTPVEILNFERRPIALLSYILMLKFVSEHDRNIIKNIEIPTQKSDSFYLYLGSSVLTQLNVIPNKISEAESSINSLYALLCKTSTPMGKRLLKDRLINPIVDSKILNERYELVEAFIPIYKDVERYLSEITDIERLHRKISLLSLQPSEFAYLHNSYNSIINLISLFKELKLKSLNQLFQNYNWEDFYLFKDDYSSIFNIEKMAKYNLNKLEESFLNLGINESVDKVDFLIKKELSELELIANSLSNEIESGTFYAKVEFNERDGFHISMSLAKFKLIKSETLNSFKITKLINSVKLRNSKIDELSNKIISHKLKLSTILREEYLKYLDYFYQKYRDSMSNLVEFVSLVDLLKTIAKVSHINGYVKPEIINSDEPFLEISNLRHPLIEKINQHSKYIPNDIFLGNKKFAKKNFEFLKDRELINGMLIYGTNASGKSSLMKSVGLAIIMAQAGFFVPANSFRFSLFNSLFTRISGDDNIFKGLSSFAVEMIELRDILNRVCSKSLVLGDEISHGTETTSAQAIVASTIIELNRKNTLFIFATHLHQLSKMGRILSLKEVLHFHLKVIYDRVDDKLIYDRKLQLGSGSAVYGLEVAKSLNLDSRFLNLAYEIRDEIMMEEDELTKLLQNPKKSNYNRKLLISRCAICGEEAKEVHHISPKELAINNLVEHLPINHKSNLVPLCYKHHQMVHNCKIIINGFITTSRGLELSYEFKE